MARDHRQDLLNRAVAMQPVVMVEIVDRVEVADRVESGAGAAPGPRRPRWARRWWPIAMVGAVVVVALVATSAVRSHERAERLATDPQVLAALGPTLRERWRHAAGWHQGETANGDLLLGRDDGTEGSVLVALDPTTGEPRWVAPLARPVERGGPQCIPLGEPDAESPRVACYLVIAAGPRSRQTTSGSVGRGVLVVLDGRTGERVGEYPMLGERVWLAAFGEDLIVSQVLPDGHAQVARRDPLSATPRWTFRSAEPLRAQTLGPTWLTAEVQGSVIMANGPVTWALSADGAVLGEWHLEGGDWAVRGGWGLDVTTLSDGRFAVGESGGVGLSDDDYGTVSVTDARDGYRIRGPVLKPAVDDGSARSVLLTRPSGSGGVVAQDAATGASLWEIGGGAVGDALVLDGRVVVAVNDAVLAVDARSGEALWTVEVPAGNYGRQVLTDGRSILIPMIEAGRGAELVAVDPADGRRLWAAPLPAGVTSLQVADHRLIAVSGDELVALG